MRFFINKYFLDVLFSSVQLKYLDKNSALFLSKVFVLNKLLINGIIIFNIYKFV